MAGEEEEESVSQKRLCWEESPAREGISASDLPYKAGHTGQQSSRQLFLPISASPSLAQFLFTSGSSLFHPARDFLFLQVIVLKYTRDKTCYCLILFFSFSCYSSVLSSTTGRTKIRSLKALEDITVVKSIYRAVTLHCGFHTTVSCVESEIQ